MAGPEISVAELRDRLRRLREIRGLTMEQAAGEAGVSYATWHRWETGSDGASKPDPSFRMAVTFLRLAEWAGLRLLPARKVG